VLVSIRNLKLNQFLQILLGSLATVAAIASAVAAWKSSVLSQSALDFQKKLAKHQNDVFALRLTLTNLNRLKRIIRNPLATSDDEFSVVELIYLEIKNDLDRLTENTSLPLGRSAILVSSSLTDLIQDKDAAANLIDTEMKMIEATISDLLC
jgi:hypothetical protein